MPLMSMLIFPLSFSVIHLFVFHLLNKLNPAFAFTLTFNDRKFDCTKLMLLKSQLFLQWDPTATAAAAARKKHHQKGEKEGGEKDRGRK